MTTIPQTITPTLDLFSLNAQNVLITGAARGLGLMAAIACLESGAKTVYCLDILPTPDITEWDKAENVIKEKGEGQKIVYKRVDVTVESEVQKVVKEVYEEIGGVSKVLAAAGVVSNHAATEFPAEEFRRIMDINVTGVFLTIRAAAAEMIARGIKGSIVMIASMSGSVANKGSYSVAYNSSKAALIQMARSAAAEWGQNGIRVNTLSPGYIRTAMTDILLSQHPEYETEWLRGSMLGRLSTPDELRGPILYLLSDASSFMTGSDLLVDGGHTAW